MYWTKSNFNLFASLIILSNFLSCEDAYVEYDMLEEFVVIDFRDNGVCPVPILVKSHYNAFHNSETGDVLWSKYHNEIIYILYSNPMFGFFGEHEARTDPPWKTMIVKDCRMYIGSRGITANNKIPVKLDVLHLVSGREAHFDGELTPFYRKDFPQCPKTILGNEEGWKKWQACGDAVAPLLTMTLELQDPVSEFDWETILTDEMSCQPDPE